MFHQPQTRERIASGFSLVKKLGKSTFDIPSYPPPLALHIWKPTVICEEGDVFMIDLCHFVSPDEANARGTAHEQQLTSQILIIIHSAKLWLPFEGKEHTHTHTPHWEFQVKRRRSKSNVTHIFGSFQIETDSFRILQPPFF